MSHPHTLVQTREGTDVILRIPVPCPFCSTMSAWYRNEGGKTLGCINCVIKTEKADHPFSYSCLCQSCREYFIDLEADRAYDAARDS